MPNRITTQLVLTSVRRSRWGLPCLALAVAVVVIYAPVVGFPFVWYDDDLFLLKNPNLERGLDLEAVRWAFTGQWRFNWVPLTWLAWMVQKEVFGGWAAGAMHTVGAGLHLLNASLVWWWLRRLGTGGVAALAGALLFAVHPLNVEAVAWVTAQKDTLSLACGLGALLAWESRRHGWCGVLFALGMLFKQSLVMLPACLLVKEWLTGGQRHGRVLLWLAGIAVLTAGVRLLTSYTYADDVEAAMVETPGRRMQATCLGPALLLLRWVWPVNLHCHYEWPTAWPAWQIIAAVAALAAISVGLWHLRGRDPCWSLACVGWAWFLMNLLPVILPPRRGAWVAERFFYWSGLGLALLAAVVVGWLWQRRTGRKWLLLAAALGLPSLVVCARQQVWVWRDSETLLRENIRIEPWSAHGHAMLGVYALDHQQYEAAVGYFQSASRLAPHDVHYLNELGMLHGMAGRHADAEKALRRALALNPRHAAAQNNLATLLRETDRLDEALQYVEQALSLAPTMAEAHLNAAIICERLGRAEEAARHGAEWKRLGGKR